jgi:hypothetical protein
VDWNQSEKFPSGITIWTLKEKIPELRRDVSIRSFREGNYTVTWGSHQTCHITSLIEAMQIAEKGIAAILNPPKRAQAQQEGRDEDLADV